MKKKAWILLFMLIMLLPGISASAAELVDENTAVWLLENHEQFFPVRVVESEYHFETEPLFYTSHGSAVSDVQPSDGAWNINVYGSQDPMNSYLSRTMIYSGSVHNFYMAVDVVPKDVYPADKAGCVVSYTNTQKTGVISESNMMLYLGDRFIIEKNSPESSTTVEFTGMDGGNRIGKTTHIEIIRLFGYSFYFADKVFLGQALDNFSDPLLISLGAMLLPEGESASCYFDNLVVRKMVTGNYIGKTDEELRLEREKDQPTIQELRRALAEQRYADMREAREKGEVPNNE